MSGILITNNRLSKDTYENDLQVIYLDSTFLDVLITVRDYVQKGYALLSHPLSGSVKPNENPFKSVMISGKKGQLDEDSVRIIENAILMAKKFPVKFQNLTEAMRKDFEMIDCSLISSFR